MHAIPNRKNVKNKTKPTVSWIQEEKYHERTAASKLCENSLNSVSVSPSNMSEWEQLSRTLTIAWVAQALLMT